MAYNLFPQAPWPVAQPVAEQAQRQKIKDLSGNSGSVDGFPFSAVGGSRIQSSDLSSIREKVIEIAGGFGFPGDFSQGDARRKFDSSVAALLHVEMGISPNEASRNSLWQYMTCFLLPDVVRWRFRGSADTGTAMERFKGGVRNTFQRLWWQAEILAGAEEGKDRYDLVNQLYEDELVQIMERPAVRGNRRLVTETCRKFLDIIKSDSDIDRELFMREIQKRIIQLLPFIVFESLSDDELREIVNRVVQETAEVLKSEEK